MTAGYSGTPLPTKLGIRDGHRVALIGAPTGFGATLGELPPGVEPVDRLSGRAPFDVILLFSTRPLDLEKGFSRSAARLAPTGGLWVAWPKKASGVATDLTENLIRSIGLAGGLVDNKVCAIDDTRSGLRFVIRLKDRARRGHGGASGVA